MNNNMGNSTGESVMGNFTTPPPNGNNKSRTDHLPGEMLEGTEWHIEISPISQSRDSDVAHELLPIDPPVGADIFTSPTALDYLVQSVPLEEGDNITPLNNSKPFIEENTGVSTEVQPSSENSKSSIEHRPEVSERPSSCDDPSNGIMILNTNVVSLSQNDEMSTSTQSKGSTQVSRTRTSAMNAVELTGDDGINDPSKQSPSHAALNQGDSSKESFQGPQKMEKLNSTLSDSSNGDLSNARRQVDESSLEFIERIRTAAHRRKVAMTRSRDSLVAKEREHLLCIAASKSKMRQIERTNSEAGKQPIEVDSQRDSQVASSQFKARPLPSTTFDKGMGGLSGIPKVDARPLTTPFSPLLGSRRKDPIPLPSTTSEKGMGGLSGVPKVDTRPPTTPFSPLLGSRRKELIRIKALDPPKQPIIGGTNKQGGRSQDTAADKRNQRLQKCGEKTVSTFKARPMPSATGFNGHAGQAGVPKIAKRPVTIPSSPLLGHRRPKKTGQNGSQAVKGHCPGTTQRPSSRTAKMVSPMCSGSPPLQGLELLEVTTGNSLLRGEIENTTPRNAPTGGYEPYSTGRAKKRAQFDAERDRVAQKRMDGAKQQQEVRIKLKHKELRQLRQSLGK